MKTCICNHSRIIAQHIGRYDADRDLLLRDRLGSAQQILSSDHRTVRRYYTYSPFGRLLQTGGSQSRNIPLRFTGRWFDDEIGLYYPRTRMYHPDLTRFTARDPVFGKFQQPLTLHKYLYRLGQIRSIGCYFPNH